MTTPEAGHLLLVAALVACLGATASSIAGRAVAARRALLATAALLSVATALLARAIVVLDYSMSYVADVASRSLNGPYRLAGLWAGMDGSLLLWATTIAAVGALWATSPSGRSAPAACTIVGTLIGSLTAITLLLADPFRTLAIPAIDGAGITPILEHPAMLVHPPLLYLGLALTVPLFALTVVGARREGYAAAAARLAVASWTVLTLAMVIGAAWAYDELGWGGYWAWDPVENGVLLPWLLLTALVHALRTVDRSRTVPKLAVALALGVFVAAMTGALLARSGAASSVHAFAQANAVGRALAALATVIVAIAATTIARHPSARPFAPHSSVGRSVALSSAGPIATTSSAAAAVTAPPARLAGLMTAQQVVLAVITAIVALGTIGPVVAVWSGGRKRAVSGHFYAALCAPAAAALIVLLVASRPWRRDRSRPSRLAHGALLVLTIGIVLSTWSAGSTTLVSSGSVATLGGHRLVVGTVEVITTDRFQRLAVPVTIDGGQTLHPALDVYESRGVALADVALASGWMDDIELAVRQITPAGVITLEAHERHGVRFIWLGALGLVLAGAFALGRGSSDVVVGQRREAVEAD